MCDENKHDVLLSKGESTTSSHADLYVVSINKFLILFVITIGGYAVYWSYRNWVFYRDARGAEVTPFMRGIFWPFFIMPLFERINAGLQTTGEVYRWYPTLRGVSLIGVTVLSFIAPLFLDAPADPRLAFAISATTLAVTTTCFIGAQRAINRLAGDPEGTSNREFTTANIVWIILGGVYWVVAFGIMLFGDVGYGDV